MKLNILDIGCGGGLLSEPMARLGANVTGIDPVKRNIEIAKHHLKKSNLNISLKKLHLQNVIKKACIYYLIRP